VCRKENLFNLQKYSFSLALDFEWISRNKTEEKPPRELNSYTGECDISAEHLGNKRIFVSGRRKYSCSKLSVQQQHSQLKSQVEKRIRVLEREFIQLDRNIHSVFL